MMRITPGTLIIALFAVLLASLVAIEVRRRMLPVDAIAAIEGAEKPISVPIAARDLEPGRPLTDSDFGVVPLTQAQLRDRHAPPMIINNPRQIIGRVLNRPLPKDAFFQGDDFYSDRMGPTLDSRVKSGFRAVTVAVDNVGVLAGHAVPGAMVDVLFRSDKTGNSNDGFGMPIGTLSVVADVEVLAVDDNAVPGAKTVEKNAGTKERTVTLAVPAEKASRLKVVEGRGTLSLLLRNKDDRDVLPTYKPETLEALMGFVPPKGPFISQMYRRGESTTLVFQNGMLIGKGASRVPVRASTSDDAPVAAPTNLPPQSQNRIGDQIDARAFLFPYPPIRQNGGPFDQDILNVGEP